MPTRDTATTPADMEALAPEARGNRQQRHQLPEQPAGAPPLKKKPTSKRNNNYCCRNITLLLFGLVVACGIAGLCYYTASEYNDDDNKYSEYFPFEWTFAEQGVLMGEPSETASIQVTNLEACKQYCKEIGHTSGNFFDTPLGQVITVSRRRSNCFCMQDVICVAAMTEQEDTSSEEDAPTGTAFSKTRRVKSPACAQTYCDFSTSQCN